MYRYVFVFVSIFGLTYQVKADNITLQNQNQYQQSSNNTQAANSSKADVDLDLNTDNISIYVYIGAGFGIIILFFAIQTCCLVWYFKRVKLRRINEIARRLNQNTTSSDSVRYYKHTSQNNNAIKTVQQDLNVYECLSEMQRAPTPPSLDSLPRLPKTRTKPIHPPLISTETPISVRSHKSTTPSRNNVKETRTPVPDRQREPMPLPHEIPKSVKETRTHVSVKQREPMPLPHDIPKPEALNQTSSMKRKPKMLPLNETGPMVTTLPSRITPKPMPHSVSKSNIHTSHDNPLNIELFEKLKKRAELSGTAEDHSTSSNLTNQSNTWGSRKPADMKLSSHVQMPSKQVQYTGGYEQRDSSDNEWTIEQLEPYNLYNI